MSYVVIVGAGSDMAKAIARKYAENGYNLYLTARNEDQLQQLKKDIVCRFEVDVITSVLDLASLNSHRPQTQALPQDTIGCVMAVGYLGDQELAQNDTTELTTTINSNLTGVIHYLNHFANLLESKKEGFIVAIGSVAGDRGRKKNYIYGCAKAGLEAYLSGLRNRLYDKNVSVLAVKPGFVYTKMTQDMDLPEKLTSTPEHVAMSVFKGQQKGRNVIYVSAIWQLIMLIIKYIPESIFKKLDI